MADKYLLRVTAGPSYDPQTHQTVLVNSPTPTHITSPHCTTNLNVRIQKYRGLPRNSPPTSPYFTHPPHKTAQYSISFTLLPHTSIPGPALLFGNDFDHPIRDRLPPGFASALKIVKWAIDPGLEGDVYGDRPYLYGCALSSVNALWVGGRREGGKLGVEEGLGEEGVQEGGEGEWRRERGVPETGAERKKWALGGEGREGREGWVWEGGRVYKGDFFNGFLDFNDFSLKLPGFSLNVLGYLGGEDYLRYVLKNKDTGDVLFVVVFTLLHKEDVEREEAEAKAEAASKQDTNQDKKRERHEGEKSFEPEADDLD